MTDASGQTTYNYDNMDRLKSKVTPEGTLTYSYDAAGNLASIASSNANGASMSYSYDSLNRLQTVTDKLGTTTYSYDGASNVYTVKYPSTVLGTYMYDQLNRVTGLGYSNQSSSYVYTRGSTGNLTNASEPNGRQVVWSFDGIYRLTNEAISGDPGSQNDGSLSYGLDPVGNRTSASSTVSGLSPVSGSYTADDELSSETYDQDGNVTVANGKTFTYDSQNEMVSMNGGAVQMMYDGDGNRVAKSVTSGGVTTTTYYLVDDLNPTGLPQVMDELTNSVVTRTYTYGLQRISEDQQVNGAWTPSFYSYDGMGSVRQLTNTAGAVTDTYEYDAFGNQITHTGTTPNNYLYRGEQWDSDLGLYYLRARYYNPMTDRFLSRDPENGDLIDPATLHKYLYTSGDPVNRVDPTGRAVVETQTITLGQVVRAGAALTLQALGTACLLRFGATDFIANIEYGIDYGQGRNPFIQGNGWCAVKENSCPKGEDKHHLLPQQFRAWFAKCKIRDIDAPQFTQCVPRQCHTGAGGLHSNQNGPGTSWNGRWYTYINVTNGGQCPAGGRQAIINFMNQLEQEFLRQFLCIGGSS